MIVLLNEANEAVQKAYKEYRFSDITSLLTNLMTNEFSAYYLDYTKDILYIEKKDSLRRRQVQTVLYHAVDVMLRLWAPILVHTAEEINDIFHAEAESIHLGAFAKPLTVNDKETIKTDMERLLSLRRDIFKALEEARSEKIIGKSLEASVALKVEEADRELIERLFPNQLAQWLIVSKLEFTQDSLPQYENCAVKVTACEGQTCPRCWNITSSRAEDGLCERCAAVLK